MIKLNVQQSRVCVCVCVTTYTFFPGFFDECKVLKNGILLEMDAASCKCRYFQLPTTYKICLSCDECITKVSVNMPASMRQQLLLNYFWESSSHINAHDFTNILMRKKSSECTFKGCPFKNSNNATKWVQHKGYIHRPKALVSEFTKSIHFQLQLSIY